MTEKKNMVIKVKYPTPGKMTDKPVSPTGVTTEWNFKRIALSLGSMLLLMMMSFFYFSDDNGDKQKIPPAQQTVVEQTQQQPLAQIDSPPDKDIIAIEKSSTSSKKPVAANAKSVIRAQITSDIKNNEPVNNIHLPLKIGKEETVWLYYFVELTGMKGQAVYHEWWLNGELVSRKKVNISDDPWRTSSKQIITYTTNNDWIVRLVDESRNKLNEKSFNLELK